MSIASLDIGPALVSRTLVQERMIATLLVAFGVLAVGLACLGLYGLIAYHVTQRTSEIGIRMALGARRGDVLLAMLQQAFVWIGAGVALGVPLALSASRVAQGLLFGLSTTDALTLISAIVVICVMGLLAAYLPARRASGSIRWLRCAAIRSRAPAFAKATARQARAPAFAKATVRQARAPGP